MFFFLNLHFQMKKQNIRLANWIAMGRRLLDGGVDLIAHFYPKRLFYDSRSPQSFAVFKFWHINAWFPNALNYGYIIRREAHPQHHRVRRMIFSVLSHCQTIRPPIINRVNFKVCRLVRRKELIWNFDLAHRIQMIPTNRIRYVVLLNWKCGKIISIWMAKHTDIIHSFIQIEINR